MNDEVIDLLLNSIFLTAKSAVTPINSKYEIEKRGGLVETQHIMIQFEKNLESLRFITF